MSETVDLDLQLARHTPSVSGTSMEKHAAERRKLRNRGD
jgi:hypothetical protein